MGVDDLVHGQRANAAIGWTVAGVLTMAAAMNIATNAIVWGGLSLLLAAVVAIPALATHDWTAMAPWPILSVAAIAVIARVMGWYPEATGYVAIATFAIVIVVELDVFTPIHLSRRFAVGFAVMTTLAMEAIWIIVQFFSDQLLGTGFLSTQTELQEDIVIVTVVGFAIGVTFYWYLTRVAPAGLVDGSVNREQSP